MLRLPFTYGQVVASSGGSSTVQFSASGGLYPVDTASFPWLLQAQGVLGYDPVKQRLAVNGTDIYALDNPIAISYSSPSGPAARLSIAVALPVGEWVILRHQTYSFNAFSFYSAQGISISNVTLWAVAGMGVFTDSCRDISLSGFRIAKAAGRPMSITADGVHFSNTKGGAIVIRDSLFEGQGDDGINVPTIFQAILSLQPGSSSSSFQVNSPRSAAGPDVPLVGPGDTVNFFSRRSLAPLGTAVVQSLGPNRSVQLAPPGLPAAVALYDLINCAGSYADSFELTGTTFRNNRARGALLKTSNMVARHNIFEGVSGSAIKTETDGCYWFEGHPVANWSVVENIIRDCNFGAAQLPADIIIDNYVPVFNAQGQPTSQCTSFIGTGSFVQAGLNISSNQFFSSFGKQSVSILSTKGLTLSNNVVSTTAGCAAAALDFSGQGVVTDSVSGNVCDGQPCTTSGL
jgi:hypothetical protein